MARSASAMEGNASRTLLVSSLLIAVEDSTKYSSLYIPKLLHICRENVSAIGGSVSVVMLYSHVDRVSNPNPDLHVRREEGNTADYVGYLSRGAVYGSYDVRGTAANFLGDLLKNYMKEAYKYSRTEFSHGPSSLTD